MQTNTARFNNYQPLQVLSKCRFILKWTNLYNPSGVRVGSTKIPDLLVMSLISFQSIQTGILYFLFCYDNNFSMESISGSFPYFIGSIQMSLVYISLALRNRLIVNAIDRLQEAIISSNFLSSFS